MLRKWDWEKLVEDDRQTLDTDWCTLRDTPGVAEDVPVESRTPVLDCGFTCWNSSSTLTTTRCAVLFRRLLGVPMVSSEFVAYRDAFLFALSVHRDGDVARYDLSPEQFQAAFTFFWWRTSHTIARDSLRVRRPRQGGRRVQRRPLLWTLTSPLKESVQATRLASLRSPTSMQ